MIQVFKKIKGIAVVPIDKFFKVADSEARCHSLKVFKPICT